jgi:hypothetical protein
MKVHANGAHDLKERLKVTTSGSPRLLEPLGAGVNDCARCSARSQEELLVNLEAIRSTQRTPGNRAESPGGSRDRSAEGGPEG